MPSKRDFAYYTLKYRDEHGLHTRTFLLASSAMQAFAELRSIESVVHAAWFSAGGHCFAQFSRTSAGSSIPAQGVLPL